MEMVDHSFELYGDIKSYQSISLTYSRLYSGTYSTLLCTPRALPQHNAPGITQANQADFGALWDLVTLETSTDKKNNKDPLKDRFLQ